MRIKLLRWTCGPEWAARGAAATIGEKPGRVDAALHRSDGAEAPRQFLRYARTTQGRVDFAMTETVLVTGGAGYIGSHACKALARAGYRPVVFDDLSRGHREAVRWGPFVEGSLADRPRLAEALRQYEVAAVVHFAAYADVGESMRDPGLYYRNNLAGTLSLLEAMRECGIERIVFSSTCAVYGTPDAIPIRESAPQRPVNPYGETKLAIERALHWYGKAHGLRSISLRYFNAAGADPDGEIGERHDPETHLIPLVVEAALGRRGLFDIFGTDYPTPDGTAIRDYIHVADLADAHLRALSRLASGEPSAAFNLGTGRGHSVREVVAAVERGSGRSVTARAAPRRPGDPPVLVADAGLAAQRLGWRPTLSDLETIVATALAWHARR
jgi:UDP-arabinose 4-epimerase